MATLIVTDLAHVTVDGVLAGSVTDVLMNYAAIPGIRGDLMTAIQAWHEHQCQCHDDAVKCACDNLCDQHGKELAARDDQIAEIRAEHEAAREHLCETHAKDCDRRQEEAAATIRLLQDQLTAHKQRIEDQQAQIDALGGTELGKRMACAAKRAKLLEAKAKAEADLAALDGDA